MLYPVELRGQSGHLYLKCVTGARTGRPAMPRLTRTSSRAGRQRWTQEWHWRSRARFRKVKRSRRLPMRQALIALLGLGISCAHPDAGGPASPPPDVQRAADKLLHTADGGAFSGVVLLAYQGQPVIKKAYGLADREADTPVTLRTQFVTASVTQTFTAVAVMQLIGKGDLSAETRL